MFTPLKELERLHASGKVPSTLLFYGPGELEAVEAGSSVTYAVLCDEGVYGGCRKCDSCKLLSVGNHPDALTVDLTDQERWDLDALRVLLQQTQLKSYYGRGRVTIFKAAEELPVQAANALLKTPEEPRPNTYYILLTENRLRLPRTILSRCFALFFMGALNKGSAITDLLEVSERISGTSWEWTIQEEQRFALVKDEMVSLRESLRRIATGDEALGVAFAREIGQKKEELSDRLLDLVIGARCELLSSIGGREEGRWATLVTNLLTARYLILQRNLAAANVLTALFCELARNPYHVYGFGDELLENVVV